MTQTDAPQVATRSRPAYDSLGGWLKLIEEQLPPSEHRVIRGASSEAEIGEITQVLEHTLRSPTVVFDDIPGYQPGWRVLVNANGTIRRQAVTLGLDPSSISHERMLEFWGTTLHNLNPIPPVEVASGPIQSNVMRGADVDLTRFPAPIWHPKAGGRYIGTASLNILKDPDSTWVNLGTYRNQVLGRDRLGLWISPGKHGRIIREKYFARGKPCPIVVVVGSDPLLFMSACSDAPRYGMDELGWAGAVRNAAVEVVRGEVTGLPIPAHAEIAIEGWVDPTARIPEGPYGEAYGYYSERVQEGPFVQVERIYHRDQPVILGCPQGKPPHEDNKFGAYLRSSLLLQQVTAAGVPNVTGAWIPPQAGNRGLVVIRIKQSYPGHATQAGFIASQAGAGAYLGRYAIVVDDDVDIYDMTSVWRAVFTEVDPAEDIQFIRHAWSGPLDQALHPDDRVTNSRAVIDATRPWHRREQPAENALPPERAAEARRRWGDLLA